MALGLILLFGYLLIVWLIFFRLKLVKFSPVWGLVSAFILIHVFLIFILGLRFVTPYSKDAKVIQHTIQIIPRLTEPTLVTAVLFNPDLPVKKGQPLFQFDRRPYEYKVRQHEAALAAARQNVLVLKAEKQAADDAVVTAGYRVKQQEAALAAARQDVLELKAQAEAAADKVVRLRSDLEYAKAQARRFQDLARQGAGTREDAQKWAAQLGEVEAGLKEAESEARRARLKYESQIAGVNTTVAVAEAQLKEAEAGLKEAQSQALRALLKYESQIGGVNTTVASEEAQLEEARYYLDNTLLVAPEDGHVVNLQVRPGMVSGIFRVGGICSFICDANRYVLANFWMEHLKYVKIGQPVEVALTLYPGQIFKGKVDSIWWANGQGQYLPSDIIPKFNPEAPNTPQGMLAVKIYLDDRYKVRFPIGAQGTAAIYTSGGSWAALRRIAIRMYSWFNWLYPMPF